MTIKRVLIAVAVLLIVGVAALYMLYMAINRGLHGDLLRATLETQLSVRLGQPVRIGSAGASLFPPSLDLREITIGKAPAVRLAQVQIVTGLRGLLSRRIEEAEIVLANGQVVWPLPFALSSPRAPNEPASPPPVTIQSVRRITLRDITVVTGLPPVVIDLDAGLEGDRLAIANLTARSGKTRLQAKGAFESLSRLQARLDVKGNLSFAGYDATDLASTIAVNPQGIALNPLSFRMFDGSFRGRLDADLRGALPQLRLAGDVAGVNAAEVMKALGSEGTLTGTLGGRVSLLASGNDASSLLHTAHGTIAATVKNGMLPHLDMVRPIILAFGKPSGAPAEGSGSTFSTLAGTFALAGSTLTSDDLSLASRDFDMNGRGRLHIETSAVDAAADVVLSKELTAQSGTDLRRYAQEDGRVIVPATIHGTLEHPTVFVDVAEATRRALSNEIRRRARDFIGGLFKKKKGGG